MILRHHFIALKDFYGPGEHIFEEDLGFRQEMKEEAKSLVAREIFRVEIEEVHYNLAFYDPVTDNFYGIHTESNPINVKILPRNRDISPYIGWQCECDTHEEGEIIASFNDVSQIWDNLKIDGSSLEDVLRRSYITALN